MLTVHGRHRKHNKHRVGACNWEIIKSIKETLTIPVVANGGFATFGDLEECFKFTGVDAVMSSEALLEYPALFNGPEILDIDNLALEYIELSVKYPGADSKIVRAHLFKFLY